MDSVDLIVANELAMAADDDDSEFDEQVENASRRRPVTGGRSDGGERRARSEGAVGSVYYDTSTVFVVYVFSVSSPATREAHTHIGASLDERELYITPEAFPAARQNATNTKSHAVMHILYMSNATPLVCPG